MGDFSITALVAAGKITEDDGVLGIIQGLTLTQARSIADWLALATGGQVTLQHGSLLGGVDMITQTPDGVKMNRAVSYAPGEPQR